MRNATGEEITQLEADVEEIRQQTEERRTEYGAHETEYNALLTLYRTGEEVLQSQLHVVGQREYTFRQLEAEHNEKIENIATLRATIERTKAEYEAFILERDANTAEARRMRTELHNNNNELERLITQLSNHRTAIDRIQAESRELPVSRDILRDSQNLSQRKGEISQIDEQERAIEVKLQAEH